MTVTGRVYLPITKPRLNEQGPTDTTSNVWITEEETEAQGVWVMCPGGLGARSLGFSLSQDFNPTLSNTEAQASVTLSCPYLFE